MRIDSDMIGDEGKYLTCAACFLLAALVVALAAVLA